jgi:hypothetical protein
VTAPTATIVQPAPQPAPLLPAGPSGSSKPVKVPGLGPVDPRVALVAAVGLALVVYIIYRRRTAAATDTTVTDPLTGLTQTPADGSTGGSYVNPNPGASGSDTVDLTSGPAQETWGEQAIRALVSVNYDEQFAGNTIGAYLARQAISSEQAQAVRTAWAIVGHPDPDVSIVLETTGPAPGNGGGTTPVTNPPPHTQHSYTIVHGDTLESIAAKLHVSEPTLYSENATAIEAEAKRRGLSGSDDGHPGKLGWWIFPGTVLHY